MKPARSKIAHIASFGRDGVVTSIEMAPAKLGFAIASHYLWMAEGTRKVTVRLAKPAAYLDQY